MYSVGATSMSPLPDIRTNIYELFQNNRRQAMSNEIQPNIANDIHRIHSIITRALKVSIENASACDH